MARVNISHSTWLDVAAALATANRLYLDRTYRNASGLFYVEGVRNFLRAIDSGFQITAILFSEKLLTVPPARKLVRSNRRSGVPCVSLTPEQFRSISHSERASGIGAIVRQHWLKLDDISAETGLCWVVLETVRSPGNLGTLIRTSEAVGGAGFIFIGDRIDPFAPDVVRASMGSVFGQKFVRTNIGDLRRWLTEGGCCAIGASPNGTTEFHQFDYPHSTFLFLGEERKGLTSQQQDLCQHLVRIPMSQTVDSLNLAVAGSLLMYEVYKSRF